MAFEKGNKSGRKFSADNQPTGRGRKPRIKSVPADAQDAVYSALYHALTLPDKDTAKKYLEQTVADLPEYGFLIQTYADGMTAPGGWRVTEAIIDRLFGKPKQAQEIDFTDKTPDEFKGIRIVDTRIVHRSPLAIDDATPDPDGDGGIVLVRARKVGPVAGGLCRENDGETTE